MAGFNVGQFKSTQFSDRTEALPLPALACFFAEGVKPVFTVRGLTAAEFARANEAQAQQHDIAAVVEAIASTDKGEKIEAIRELLGISDDVPDELVKRHARLVIGCVAPQLDAEAAVLLSERYPLEFYQLTNKISDLTGLGRVPGKLSGSGATPQSEPPSTCVNNGDDSSMR